MHSCTPTPSVRRHLLRGLTAGLLLTQALSSSAQEAATTDLPPKQETVQLDAFVVTGIRFGIEQAISTKKETVNLVEAISAEDIGKLPDISIAESIARLPGLAAQRVAGRAQVISVRGLSPDFATTLLNGREQVSTGDNRGVEFDQYPSELMRAVTVYKTPDARLVGQGLSGTLNLQTVQPLSFSRRAVALNARFELNSVDDLGSDSENTGNRYSLTYIDQFADKKVGFAFGYAHLESPIVSQETGTYGWNTGGRPGVPAGTFATEGLKSFARSGTNKRDGFIAVLEFRPTSNYSSMIDAYYSKFSREETARGFEANTSGWDGGTGTAPTYTATTIRNGALLGGTMANVYPLVRNMYNDRTDKLTAIGWNNQYRWDNWILVGDVSYSKAERNELNLETQAQYRSAANAPVLDTLTYDLTTGGFPRISGTLNYGDAARVQVGPTMYGAGYGKVPYVKDELTSYKVAASFGLEKVLKDVEFGVNFADRSKNKTQPEASLGVNGWGTVPASAALANTNLGFAGTGQTVSWSVPAIMAASFQPFTPSSTAYAYLIPKTWRVDEEIYTYFVQGNIDHEIRQGLRLRGNVGVQIKDVDQSSTSNFWDTATNGVRLNRDGKTYSNVLPSMNLALDFDGSFVIRAAAAKQVARPRMDQLKSSVEFGIDTNTRVPGASGGNPRLDPWKATAYDLSIEKYFAKNKGYVALAGFYKKLDTYIYDQTIQDYDFTNLIASSGSPVIPIRNTGTLSGPLNGNGGSLKGLEASLSIPFSLFGDAFEGFGLVASASRNSSSIAINDGGLGSNIALPGLSKTVTNLTFYYEKDGFGARISRRHRSDFIGEVTAFGNDRSLRYVAGEAVIDAQVGYEFRTGSLKGLGILLQVYNLTDSDYLTYRGTKDRMEEYQKYGRTFLAGVNYKF